MRCIALAVAAALTAGCANFAVPQAGTGGETANPAGLLEGIPQGKINTLTRRIVAEGVRAMEARDWRKASDLFNLALRTDVRNSHLQLLNAYAYHQRGRLGESGLLSLAEQGYDLAAQFDHSNWTAHYLHGVLAMERRDYLKAQSEFMKAALYADADRDLLYDLAVASYYAQDPKTAAAALEGLRRAPGSPPDARVLRASALVAASLNDRDGAHAYVEALRKVSVRPDEVAAVKRRVETWEATYEREPQRLAQFVPAVPGQPGMPAYPAVPVQPGVPGYGQPVVPGGAPFVPGAVPGMPVAVPGMPGMQRPMPRQPGDFVEKNMVAIDVVIIHTEEDLNNRMGVNLLDGLRLQFGNPDTRQAGISQLRTITRDPTISPFETTTNVVTRLISIPAVTYTLNIANAAAHRNHVLARPTLVALGGQTSQFFSGVDINAAAVSGGQGAPVQITKEVGVKLAVTPEFLPDGLIRLQVIAERTFLTNPSANVVFDFRLDTTKTTVNANVVMRFGETLILSGLSERDSTGDRSGVPYIQDVPVAQYFFSENADREFYKSVMIMLTPRRPQYTYRDPAIERAEHEKLSDYEREIAEFERKYREWFRPLPNSAAAFRHLSESSLLREFRTGDLSLYDWNARRTLGERLKASIDFLYY
jgi:general secretion pathway protein D